MTDLGPVGTPPSGPPADAVEDGAVDADFVLEDMLLVLLLPGLELELLRFDDFFLSSDDDEDFFFLSLSLLLLLLLFLLSSDDDEDFFFRSLSLLLLFFFFFSSEVSVLVLDLRLLFLSSFLSSLLPLLDDLPKRGIFDDYDLLDTAPVI